VEFLTQLNWIDLVIIIVLAAAVFAGWTQGFARYLTASIGALIAFIVASQLKGPLTDALSTFWTAFAPPTRELLVYLFLYIGLNILIWFVARAFFLRTHISIAKVLDEVGGALCGMLYAVVSIVFLLVVLDTFYAPESGATLASAGFLDSFYELMGDSLLVGYFRDVVIASFGYIARPLVPPEIARHLGP
jgi:uncharacterized membrane protein required for colicin V production